MWSPSSPRAAALLLLSLSALACGGIDGADEVNARYAGLPEDGITLGAPDAPLTLTEFADLQCPYCAQFARQALPTLVDDYVRPGKLRLVFRGLHFLGEDSVRGARMAGAMGLQDRLWPFVDLFYLNQEAENSGYADDDFLLELAEAIDGADADAAMSARGSAEVDAQLAEANAEGERWSVPGTPAFLLGDTGAEPEVLEVRSLEASAFTSVLDARLAP